MATKPTVLPRWANVGGDVVTPLSGKQDIGWVPQERPPAEYMNWLSLHAYNWIAWLDDLVLSDSGTAVVWRNTKSHAFGAAVTMNASIGGGGAVLDIDNTNTAGYALNVAGAATGAQPAAIFQCTGSGFSVLVQNNATNGTAVRTEKIGGGSGFALDCQGASSFTGLLNVVSGGLTVTAGLSDFQAGAKTNEADIRHANHTLWVPARMLSGSGAGNPNWDFVESSNTYYASPTANPSKMVIGIPLGVGDRLKEVHAYVVDNNGAGDDVSLRVDKQSIASGSAPGTNTQLGTTQTTSAASANVVILSVTGLTETVAADTIIYAALATGGGTLSNYRVYALKIVFDRVA